MNAASTRLAAWREAAALSPTRTRWSARALIQTAFASRTSVAYGSCPNSPSDAAST